MGALGMTSDEGQGTKDEGRGTSDEGWNPDAKMTFSEIVLSILSTSIYQL